MTVTCEVRDLLEISAELRKELFRYSFKYDGWMMRAGKQILDGYKTEWRFDSESGEYCEDRKELVYDQASAVIARDENNEIMGWALVRHPRKRVRIAGRRYKWVEQKWEYTYEYAGRRSDFMVYVRAKHRRHRVARNLLLVAYHNFGRVDVYPHDNASHTFFHRNRKFVTAHDTEDFTDAKYKAREVVG